MLLLSELKRDHLGSEMFLFGHLIAMCSPCQTGQCSKGCNPGVCLPLSHLILWPISGCRYKWVHYLDSKRTGPFPISEESYYAVWLTQTFCLEPRSSPLVASQSVIFINWEQLESNVSCCTFFPQYCTDVHFDHIIIFHWALGWWYIQLTFSFL